MTTLLRKKDYKIIWVNAKNSEKVIIELDKNILSWLISRRKRLSPWESNSLIDYIKSWEINNPNNISWTYWKIDDLINDLKKLW